MDEDNIYSYILAYNSFLKFEELGPNKRTYSPYEIAVYITSDLERDLTNRFEKGIDYVQQQLRSSPDGTIVSRDILIGKISKTICKYSPQYTVGEFKSTITPVVHAMNKTRPFQNKRPRLDTSKKCKICGQLGHDDNSEDGCMVYAKWILCQQASTRLSESETKTNTRKCFKQIKRHQEGDMNRDKFETHINSLNNITPNQDTTSIIHALKLLQIGEEYDDSSEYESDSE